MSNLYDDSHKAISMVRSGEIPKGSVIKVQWPSGNSEAVRVHGYNKERGVMIGCNMSWDNSATEEYDLSSGIVSVLSRPKEQDERWL